MSVHDEKDTRAIARTPEFEELRSRVAADIKRLKIPGVALGVWSGGREEIAVFGRTSVENPLPVTPDTLFQIGSITKTMTTTALLRLVEMGRLDLDAPIRGLLSGFSMADPDVAARLTTRHLLTHTGGWAGDYFNDFGNGDDALARMVESIGHLPQVTALGAYFSYNNAGFNIASRVLEVLYGKPYEDAMRELIFEPLGLSMSFFYPSDILITHRFVAGHQKWGATVKVARPWAIGRAGNGVGGAVLSIRDLLAYARFHLRSGMNDKGERVMGAATVESMRTPSFDAGARGWVGLSWFIKDIGGLAAVGHGGATKGQESYLCLVPEKDFAVALLTNSGSGGIITDKLRGWALDIWFGAKASEPVPVPASDADIAERIGFYDQPLSAYRLERWHGGLRVQNEPRGGFPKPDTPPGPPDPPSRAALLAGDRLLLLDEPSKGSIGEFIRDSEGRIVFLRLGGRIHRKLS